MNRIPVDPDTRPSHEAPVEEHDHAAEEVLRNIPGCDRDPSLLLQVRPSRLSTVFGKAAATGLPSSRAERSNPVASRPLQMAFATWA